MSLLDWGRLEEAAMSTHSARDLDPFSTYALWSEGLVRLAQGDYSGAAGDFKRMYDLDGLWTVAGSDLDLVTHERDQPKGPIAGADEEEGVEVAGPSRGTRGGL